jgi:hypothetical protein
MDFILNGIEQKLKFIRNFVIPFGYGLDKMTGNTIVDNNMSGFFYEVFRLENLPNQTNYVYYERRYFQLLISAKVSETI